MAEGLLGGLLGGEEEGDGTEAAEALRLSPEALSAALAIDEARRNPALAKALSALVRAQTEEIAEQRALRLRHLESQSREGKLRRFGQRVRNGMQVFTALALSAIGVGVCIMLVDAFNSKSVVVDPFDAPPALAARGLTGKVVASGVLDTLTRLQAVTRSNDVGRRLAGAWSGDIKVEVPETGVSIGDLDRMLKARFGHELHIAGDLVQTEAGGLALTIRGDGVLPKTFDGGSGDLDKLTTQAAEYAYSQSQPALYVVFLTNAGRSPEAVAFAKGAYAATTAADRPLLLNSWAIALGNTGAPAQATRPLYVEAVRLKPDFWTAYNNLMNVDLILGDEEDAWREGETLRRRGGGRPGRAAESEYQNEDLVTWNLLPWRAAILADAAAHAGVGTGSGADAPSIADIDVRLHDAADAELQLQTSRSDATDPTVSALTHFVHGRLAAEAGDTVRAVSEMEAFQTDFANPTVAVNYAGYNCWVAPAEEAAGRPDKADVVLSTAGRYVDCYRFRGDILDHRGDWTGAQAAYARAVAIAPDLPAAFYSWGVALERHGDLAWAQAKLSAAHERGPGWADPLKAWGDVLARQGHWREALAKYDAALKLAPAWIQLRQARDVAARKS
jgi:tetratricopeptide (TPR) repeat protein